MWGDLNVLMDYDMDISSFKRNKKSVTNLVGNAWEEMSFFCVERSTSTAERF